MLEPGQAVQASEPTTKHLNGNGPNADNGDNGEDGHRDHHTDAPLMALSTPTRSTLTDLTIDDCLDLVTRVIRCVTERYECAIAQEDVAFRAATLARATHEEHLARSGPQGILYPSAAYLAAEHADLEAGRAWADAMHYRNGVWDARNAVEQEVRAWEREHPSTWRLGGVGRGGRRGAL